MTLAPQMQFLKFVVIGLLLGCGSFGQLAQLSSSGPAVATGVALVDAGEFSVLAAYQNLDKLPGFHLQAEQAITTENGETSTLTVTRTQDAAGNRHTTSSAGDDVLHEDYVIDGQTYAFNRQYDGWVVGPTSVEALDGPHRWLLQMGVVPVEAGRETLEARSATRYRLNYLLPKLAEAQGQADLPKISGTLWVDDETGALLKSDIQIVESGQARQKYTITVTQIGQIAPLQAPTPVVSPGGIAAATATAQAWSTLQTGINYQGRRVEFELVPVDVSQQANSATAEMHLLLRNLPPELLQAPEPAPFLTQLGARLQLSIPQNNLSVASTNFTVENTNPAERSITVTYLFNADLEAFNHVELILANAGNPVIAPVPVAGR